VFPMAFSLCRHVKPRRAGNALAYHRAFFGGYVPFAAAFFSA
jgi:hypothetical protein